MEEANYDQYQGEGFGLEKAVDDMEERNLWDDNRVGKPESLLGAPWETRGQGQRSGSLP